MEIKIDLFCIAMLSVMGVAIAMALGAVMLVLLGIIIDEVEDLTQKWRKRHGREKDKD